jgi:hypothetical protein
MLKSPLTSVLKYSLFQQAHSVQFSVIRICSFRSDFTILHLLAVVFPNSLCHHIATEVSSLFGSFRLVLNLTSSNAFQLPSNGFQRPILLFQYMHISFDFLRAKFLESWLTSVWLWNFFNGDSKLVRFLAKNQPTERKLYFIDTSNEITC